VKIKEVEKGTIAARLGISKDSEICSINGNKIRDEIDLMFYESDENLNIEIEKDRKRVVYSVEKLPEERLGIVPTPFRFRRCNNACIFCFYDQMPGGLRESLYEKDDDYRLSFLYGNYITLTNMVDEDYKRIEEQRLSPLFVSIHSTNPEIRAMMLGRKGKSFDIMHSLERLNNANIEIHSQVVICPGINDGAVLEKTVFELAEFFPNIRSVAIVPVGLTKHRKGLFPLREMTKVECLEIVQNVFIWQELFRKRFGLGFVYPSDELLMKAEFAIPMSCFYDAFPQLENGVGNSRIFLDDIDALNTDGLKNMRAHIVFITSMLPFPWVNLLRKRLLLETSISCDVLSLTNKFFGNSITVSGLLVGKDILYAIKRYKRKTDLFIVPQNGLNEDELFLDGLSISAVNRLSGKNVIALPSPVSLLQKILKKEILQ